MSGADTAEWPLVVTGGPWPERIGLRAREVQRPDGVDHYPWDKRLPRTEVIVLIENDPHCTNGGWSCVMSRSNLSGAA